MNFCNLLKTQPAFKHSVGVDEETIQSVEELLGVRFANDYRSYLAEYGEASYYGHELTGLNCPRYVNVADVTLEQRELYPEVPIDLYVVEEAGIDGIVYWQDGEGLVYRATPNGRPVRYYDSLAEYSMKVG